MSKPTIGSVAWDSLRATILSNQSLQSIGIVVATASLVITVAVGNPAFLSGENLANMLSQWAAVGIIAAGMTFVVLTGGFDLSVASAYSLTAVVSAYIGQMEPLWLAVLGSLLTGATIGAMNGFLISVIRLNPFVVTVGTGFILNGVALVLTQNAAFVVSNESFSYLGTGRWMGVPYSGVLMLLILAIGSFVLAKTIYGESVFAVGGNAEASALSGIHVRRVVFSVYVVLGTCVGLAGALTASELNSAQADMDAGIIFDILTIVVVGGNSLSGGYGAMWRTAIGLVIVATISNGFVLLNISPYYQAIIKGVIIVCALALDRAVKSIATRTVFT